MTTEVRTLVDIGDISGIEVECPQCSSKVFYPVAKGSERLLSQCPNCNENLFIINRNAGGTQGSLTLEQIKVLMRILKFLAVPAVDCTANVRLQVENGIKGHTNLARSMENK
jgi:predicted  nucleic acid-binding Zn-ribbon protein